MRWWIVAVSWLAGCSGGEERPGGPSRLDDTAPTEPPTGPSTGDTGEALPVYDCDEIPIEPLSRTLLPGARGYHDLALTPLGTILGASKPLNPDMLQSDYEGNVSVFSPGLPQFEQMTWLPDGTLAIASLRGILRLGPAGGSTVINGSVSAYGLILGPDGMLYAAAGWVYRVDPDTGESTVLVRGLPDGTARVIAFGRDYHELYIGTRGGSRGQIFVVQLDEDLDPVSDPEVFVTGIGIGDYHDTMGVDICGYLYVSDYSDRTLYRISPSGRSQVLFAASGGGGLDYPHGLEWGSGLGGFRDDAIYLAQPYNDDSVTELVIGVPSRDWRGTAIHLP